MPSIQKSICRSILAPPDYRVRITSTRVSKASSEISGNQALCTTVTLQAAPKGLLTGKQYWLMPLISHFHSQCFSQPCYIINARIYTRLFKLFKQVCLPTDLHITIAVKGR